MKNQSYIIVALDFSDLNELESFVSILNPKLCKLKVGKELFVKFGPKVVEFLKSKGFDIFLDLKFHDIPNTVFAAVKASCELGVWMLNVHASGGEEMLTAAREAVDKKKYKTNLIAVTVLTSFDRSNLSSIGVQNNIQEQVKLLGELAFKCNLDGVVCSPNECLTIKKINPVFLTVTPGIRFNNDNNDDQKRVYNHIEARNLGSDYLVIGRSVTRSKDPLDVLRIINSDLEKLSS